MITREKTRDVNSIIPVVEKEKNDYENKIVKLSCENIFTVD